MLLAHRTQLIAAAAVLGVGLTFALPARAIEITAPVDVGVGPAIYHGGGKLFEGGAPLHYGLKFNLAAIISQQLIKKNIRRVPKKWRKRALRIKELRYRPSILVPDSLIISPKLNNTGMYGVTWRPIGLNMPLSRGAARLELTAGVLFTAAIIHSDTMTTWDGKNADWFTFIRPGVDVGGNLEIPITDVFLISMGWVWQAYIPQLVGGGFLETSTDAGGYKDSIWSMAQAYLRLHFRFPYTTNI